MVFMTESYNTMNKLSCCSEAFILHSERREGREVYNSGWLPLPMSSYLLIKFFKQMYKLPNPLTMHKCASRYCTMLDIVIVKRRNGDINPCFTVLLSLKIIAELLCLWLNKPCAN